MAEDFSALSFGLSTGLGLIIFFGGWVFIDLHRHRNDPKIVYPERDAVVTRTPAQCPPALSKRGTAATNKGF